MPKPGEVAPILGTKRIRELSRFVSNLLEMPLQRLPIFLGAALEGVGVVHRGDKGLLDGSSLAQGVGQMQGVGYYIFRAVAVAEAAEAGGGRQCRPFLMIFR